MSANKDRLEMIERHREAIAAALELKTLEKAVDAVDAFKDNQDEMSHLTERISVARSNQGELEVCCKEAQEYSNKLQMANQNFEELNIPLEYGDHKKMALFKRSYGLEFKVTEDRAIVFSFYHLSKRCPEQHCDITMDVENEQWKVLHLDPPIHGVQTLLEQLNNDGDLKTFCRQVRQKFKDYVSEHSN